ncbi:MAG: rRNA cytosine-C5-methyltransferase, partial [Muribaculaceae bacterium]|nr:rRNA cytosine-C5-methyltransferase [Muribaculaceae bacterium]
IVANEVNNARALALTDNVVKWGCENVVVASSAPKTIGTLTAYFDVIAADVPCSGEGMMRKEAEAVSQWSPRLVADCAALQRTIIDDVWVALKPGGLLIYSTCTFNREENERNVEYIVERYGAEPVEVPIEAGWNITPGIDTALPCYRFMPHRTRGEGLFMCVLHKPEGSVTPVSPRAKKSAKAAVLPAQVKGWVRNAEDMSFDVAADKVTIVPARYVDDVQLLQSTLRTLLTGIEIAVAKGRDWAPTQSLAMWRRLASGVFPEVELTYADAMAYLRGESLRIDAPRGYVLVCRHGHRLGFVNNLGSRANNLYPKPWRTLKAQYPNDEPRVVE